MDVPTALSTNVDTTLSEEDFQEFVNDRVASFALILSIHQKTPEEIAKAQEKQKHYYDKKQISTSFRSGDQLLLKNKKRLNRIGDNFC